MTAKVALERYWANDELQKATATKAAHCQERLAGMANRFGGTARGRGLIQGLAFDETPELASAASKAAFENGLILETSGAHDEVLKFLPALTITEQELDKGLDVLERALEAIHRASKKNNGASPQRWSAGNEQAYLAEAVQS